MMVRLNYSRLLSSSSMYVPKHSNVDPNDILKITRFIQSSEKLIVLTGAGVSTESGIPDYRSEGVGLYATSDKRPIQHQDFLKKPEARRRYWARNFMGWSRWSNVQPNTNHLTLARWEAAGILSTGIVTQNVDQLHYKAGSSKVIEIHGTNSIVCCLNCSYEIPRLAFQRILESHNPRLVQNAGIKDNIIRPDGDVELNDDEISTFQVPECPKCDSGPMKPKVVFFGDNVPAERVEKTKRWTESSDSLLVIGSSLHVFSGYRIALWAKESGLRIAILNIGSTRADHLADLKIEAKVGDILPRVHDRIFPSRKS